MTTFADDEIREAEAWDVFVTAFDNDDQFKSLVFDRLFPINTCWEGKHTHFLVDAFEVLKAWDLSATISNPIEAVLKYAGIVRMEFKYDPQESSKEREERSKGLIDFLIQIQKDKNKQNLGEKK